MQRLPFASAHRLDFNRSSLGDTAGAVEVDDFVFLEQVSDAAGELIHHPVFARQQGFQIQRQARRFDSVFGKVRSRLGIHMGRLQDRLGGDAAHVQAGAPQSFAGFHTGHRHAQLGGADGGHVAAGSSADNDNIIAVGAHRAKCPATCAGDPRCIP